MSLVSIPSGILLPAARNLPFSSSVNVDAAGEYFSIVGEVHLENGSAGGTKTISAAGGGGIALTILSLTWASGSSNLRAGIQPVVASTGLGNGTYDVFADVTGGAGLSTGFNLLTMTSGSKTLTESNIICVQFELTARGGADIVRLRRATLGSNFPYGIVNIGSPTKDPDQIPPVFLFFDDGTVGWINGLPLTPDFSLAESSANGGTTTELGAVFQLPYTCQIDTIGWDVNSFGSSEGFEPTLYSDPYGTPSALRTMNHTPDPDIWGSTGMKQALFSMVPITLTAGVSYGVGMPISVGTIGWGYYDPGSAFEKLKRAVPLGGTSLRRVSRTGSPPSGAFADIDTYTLPSLYLRLSQLDDGSGGGSGGGLRLAGHGGLVA